MILSRASLNQYVISLAKSLYTRGFEVDGPAAEFDESGHIVFGVKGTTSTASGNVDAEISLDEVWQPMPARRWERDEYAYDLIDHGRGRRRALHLHDRALAEASLRSTVHEHCEEVIGAPACGHYLGHEIPDGHVALELLTGAWLEPGPLGCDRLVCIDPGHRRRRIVELDPDLDLDAHDEMRRHRFET